MRLQRCVPRAQYLTASPTLADSGSLSSAALLQGPPVSKEELDAHLRENSRSAQQETVEFVQAFR